MLELLYIGRFDYLARPGMNAQPRIPNDAEVEASLQELEAREHKREAVSNSDIDQRKSSARD